jgi:hypothetical protein
VRRRLPPRGRLRRRVPRPTPRRGLVASRPRVCRTNGSRLGEHHGGRRAKGARWRWRRSTGVRLLRLHGPPPAGRGDIARAASGRSGSSATWTASDRATDAWRASTTRMAGTRLRHAAKRRLGFGARAVEVVQDQQPGPLDGVHAEVCVERPPDRCGQPGGAIRAPTRLAAASRPTPGAQHLGRESAHLDRAERDLALADDLARVGVDPAVREVQPHAAPALSRHRPSAPATWGRGVSRPGPDGPRPSDEVAPRQRRRLKRSPRCRDLRTLRRPAEAAGDAVRREQGHVQVVVAGCCPPRPRGRIP